MSEPTSIKGLAELQRALDTLPAKIEANIMRGAVRAAAKVVAEEAKLQAPVLSGALRDSIRVGSQLKHGRVTGRVIAGGRGKKGKASAFYAHIVERGSAAHIIQAEPGHMLAVGVSKVNHPGAAARPFLRPALDGKTGPAVEAMREYIRKRLATKYGIDVPAEPLGPDDE